MRLEIDAKTNFENWERAMYVEEIHRKLDLLPTIKAEIDDYDDGFFEDGAKSVKDIVVKINGLDVIYYGYGFGGDFHECDEKLLHINVDRNKHSLRDSKYDEFKTYKSKKKMNGALAEYGLTFEQIEQFLADEEFKLTIDDYVVTLDYDEMAETEELNADAAEKEPTLIDNKLKAKLAELRAVEKNISEKYLNLCRSLYVKIDGKYDSAVSFDDYVTEYADTFYCRESNGNYVEDTAAYGELKEIECERDAILADWRKLNT